MARKRKARVRLVMRHYVSTLPHPAVVVAVTAEAVEAAAATAATAGKAEQIRPKNTTAMVAFIRSVMRKLAGRKI